MAVTDKISSSSDSLTDILRDVSGSARDLMKDQAHLVKVEFNATLKRLGEDLHDTIVFGILASFTALPILAFLVIGLGVLLEERYWLSSLIVAVAWSSVTGYFTWIYYLRLKNQSRALAVTQSSVKNTAKAVQQSTQEMQDAFRQS